MDDDQTDLSPINPLPPAVWLLALPMAALEAAFTLGEAGLAGGPQGIGWRQAAVAAWGFDPGYFRAMAEAGSFTGQGLARCLTYAFLSLSPTQAIFAVILTMAMGKFVGEAMGSRAVLILFALGAVAGAMTHAAWPGMVVPLVGAYPAVFGLMGGVTLVMFQRRRAAGENPWTAFSLVAMRLGLPLGISIGVAIWYGPAAAGALGGVADLGGFLAGLILSPLLAPGGWQALLTRIRRV